MEEENCLDEMLSLLVAILDLRMYLELVGGLVRLAAMGFGEVVERCALPPSARFIPALPSVTIDPICRQQPSKAFPSSVEIRHPAS